MSIELPPTPATELEARRVSNQLAYGFEKHKDDYWVAEYAHDPDYYFKRMLGWQSEEGPDRAVYGLYAVPPSPWHVVAPPVEEPSTDPVPGSLPVFDIQDVLVAIATIQELMGTLATKQDIHDAREEFVNAAKGLEKFLPWLRMK